MERTETAEITRDEDFPAALALVQRGIAAINVLMNLRTILSPQKGMRILQFMRGQFLCPGTPSGTLTLTSTHPRLLGLGLDL